MAEQLRGAIVGVGHVATLGHAPAWARRADVEIVAACDPRSDRRQQLASAFPRIAWHESLASLLAREHLDFVDVCSPPAAHAAAIRQALERGVHVLCEKPLVLERSELDSLCALARECRRTLATVHNWRYAPMLARAAAVVRSGALGQVRRCRWEVLRDRPSIAVGESGAAPNWRQDPALSGGGILTDHGWHAIYVLSEWMGPPEVIGARLTSHGRPDAIAEDTADVELRFGDATAEIFLTWRAHERRNRVDIQGTGGALRVDGRTLEVSPTGGPAESMEFPEALSDGSHHPGWFGGVAAAFLEEIRSPEKRGGTLAEAAVCLSVITAARRGSGGAAAAPPVASGSGGTA